MTSVHNSQPGSLLIAIVLCAFVAFVAAYRVARPIDGTPKNMAVWPDVRIDINSASAPQLDLLPGIGPNLAEKIVEDRRQRGPFVSVNDLDRVRLIGPRTVEHLMPFAVVQNSAAKANMDHDDQEATSRDDDNPSPHE